jgi:hypothetical protein
MMEPSMALSVRSGSPSYPVSNALQIVGNSPECAVGTLEQYVLLLWRRKVVLPGAGLARQAFIDVQQSRPGEKFAFLTVVEAQCDLSTPSEVRKEFAKLLSSHQDQLAGAAIVFEDQGFRMTVVRSIITAINMASRARFRSSVFDNVRTAAYWLDALDTRPSWKLGFDRIVTAVDQMRGL